MKTLNFLVKISFADEIKDINNIDLISINIANAIAERATNSGIAPQGGDTYTTGVRVKSFLTDSEINREI